MPIAEQWVVYLFGLLLWREARSSSYEERVAVACSVRNRVKKGGWWGSTYLEVITKPGQYSSFPWFNKAGKPIIDANCVKWPMPGTGEWKAFEECCAIASNVIGGISSDKVGGSTHYYDKTLDNNPPAWAKAADSIHVCDTLNFRFYIAK